MKWRALPILLLVSMCISGIGMPPSYGQSTQDRFVIVGTVLDPSGATMPGAEVQLRSSGSSSSKKVRTAQNGTFRFERVTAGDYEIDVRKLSFQPASVHVMIAKRNPDPLSIVLPILELKEEVIVSGQTEQVNTNPGENLDVVSLDRKTLSDLPMLDQDIIGGLSQFLDSSALGTAGAGLVVNGMETSEKGVSASAIKEVKINQNPYSAEFSRPGRGRIEIVTKAGADAYHGTLNFLLRDYRLDARNAFAVQRPQEERRILEGDFTGPLGRTRKTSFLITANREDQNLQNIVYADTPQGLFRANVAAPERQTEISLGLNHQAGQSNTFSIRYEFTRGSVKNNGVGDFILPEVGSNSSGMEHHIYYTHRAILSPKIVNEFSLRVGSHDNRTLGIHAGVRRIVVQDAFTGGGSQTDLRSTENHVQFTDTIAWQYRKHSIKAGWNVPDISRRGRSDRSNFDGTYNFSSLDDYRNGLPFSFQSNQGNPHLAFLQVEMGAFLQDDYRLRPDLSLGFGLRYDGQNYLTDHNNVAPRLSFAYSPDRKRKMVIRGGAGLFYDRTGAGAISDMLRFDGLRLRQVLITNPAYPNPWSTAGNLAAVPSSVVRFAPNLRSPYSLQFGMGLERQLHKAGTLTINYTEIRGVKLYRSRDINAPLPPNFAQRPDPLVGRVRQIESSASSRSRSLEVLFRGNLCSFFNSTIQYTAGRAYNDTGGINSMPQANYHLSGEWSRADFDQRHRFNLVGTLKARDWFKLGIGTMMGTGRPYSMTLGRDVNRDGIANDRPSGVPRNSLQGPGLATLDLRWSREQRLSKKEDGPVLTMGLNIFNVLNRVNYNNYIGNLSSPFFGQPISSRPARRMQLALRFEF